MKLTTLMLIIALVQASAKGYSQKITVHEKGASLASVLQTIKNQTGYVFISNNYDLENTHVSIDVKNASLDDALKSCFKDLPLSYKIVDKTIVLGRLKDAMAIPIAVTGKVTDTAGTPLPGATIKNTTQNTSTVTIDDGTFLINAQAGDQITVSFIGYGAYNFTVSENLPYQHIILHSFNSKLSEVVVVNTGYQTIPQERATGSFAQPLKAEFEGRVSPDVLSRLNGITSGMLFNANTNLSKNGSDINIRGRSTIFANDQPLVIVDNFPYSGDINNINPNDVESVTVLKDAAAASIWGVRAGNGVIVITTKKGKAGQPLRTGFNASVTAVDRPDLYYNPNQLNPDPYISLEQFLFGKGFYNTSLTNTSTYPVISPVVELLAANRSGTLSNADLNTQLNALRSLNVNDQLKKYLYQVASDQQYALNLSGGSEKALYYFSTGYDKDRASVKDNVHQRISINSQNTFYPVKKLELTAGVNIVQAQNDLDNTLAQVRSRVFPYSQLADANGDPLPLLYQYRQNFVENAISNGFLDWSYYPLKELGATENVVKVTDVRLSTGIKYTLFNGLSAQVKYQYENTNNANRYYQSQATYYTRTYINQFSVISGGKVTGRNVPLGGILSLSNGSNIANNLRVQLNFDRQWGEHRFTALAGYEISEVTGNSNQSILYGYNDDLSTFTNVNTTSTFSLYPTGGGAISSGLGISSSIVRVRSSFANAAYTYRDRYTISGSARIDGTNYFGVSTNQKNLPLWSAGVKWDIAKEGFYKAGWLPGLAFRASYGYNGNLIQSITGVTTFQYYSNAAYTNLNYAQVSNIGNPDLRWEKTGIMNIGADFGLKNNLISGSLEFYFKKETDLLGFKTFPENSGISKLEGNYSDMSGRGFDLSLTANVLNGEFKWSSTILLSHATDMVTHYDIAPLGPQLVGAGTGAPNQGRPVFGVYGYRWKGLDPATGNPIGYLNGSNSQNYAAITTTTPVSDLAYFGAARPVYFGGFNNRFSYHDFSLAVQVSYKLGYYFMAPALSYSAITSGGAFLRVNRDWQNRWQKPGDEAKTNVPSMNYPFNSARDQFYQYSEINIEKGDHVRLQNVTLSYNFNRSAYPHLPFSNLQLYLFADNVGMIWRANHRHLDPDAVPSSGDNTTVPLPRSIAIGIKGGF